MFVNLDHPLFKVSPDERFSQQFNLPRGTWMGNKKSIWYKYKWLEYDIPELQEYIEIIHKVKIHRNTLMRWFNRTEIYLMAERYRNRKAVQMRLDEFGPYTNFLSGELRLRDLMNRA